MKPRIAIFIHQPKCSVQSGNGIIHALESDFVFKIFTKHRVEKDFFDDVDMIAVPGGLGDADTYSYLMRENQKRIRDYVDSGGRYLGICMGAYWAGSEYLDILTGIDTVQYIRRPRTDTRRPHAKAIDVMWQGQPEKMFFYDGCAITGRGKLDVTATYANGDAMAGYQGRIGLIGCHPESEPHWYNSYSYMKLHWHQGHHHNLLKSFANELMKR